jgi:hypothetical protein
MTSERSNVKELRSAWRRLTFDRVARQNVKQLVRQRHCFTLCRWQPGAERVPLAARRRAGAAGSQAPSGCRLPVVFFGEDIAAAGGVF